MGKKLLGRLMQTLRSIQLKIFMACSLVAIISIIVSTYSTYVNSARTIEKNAFHYIYESVLHADENLNIMLEDIEKISTVIVVNKENVIDALNSPHAPVSYEWFLEKKRMEEFLHSLMAYKPYISRVAVVGLDGKLYQVGAPQISAAILEQSWVKGVLETNRRKILYNLDDSPGVSLGRPIYFEHQPIGFVRIDFSPDIIQKVYDIKPLSSESFIFTVTAWGDFIFSSSGAITQKNILDTPFRQTFADADDAPGEEMLTIQGKKYLTVRYTSGYTGLTTIGLIYYEKLIGDALLIRNQMVRNLILIFVVVLFISIFVSSRITKNLKKLRDAMMLVQEGDLSARPAVNSRDEVGQLSEGFTGMMDKINKLMEEIKVKEQKALQSQIGPHFIYNALNTIKYLARLQNITNIDEISGALVELLRSVLGNVRETVTIREELEYVKGYVLIQKYKFLDRVKVFFDVEEEVLEAKILKLILQPVVENAMLHGIASRKEGTVLIKIYREDKKIVFEVTDNGVGMTPEQINKAMNMEGQKDNSRFSSAGLRNVEQRIKLAYGDAYGLQIYSCPGLFTTVEMSVPEVGEGTKADAS